MIIDLERFVAEERPYWSELEGFLDRIHQDRAYRLDLDQAKRVHYLYQRTSADLAKVGTFASEPALRRYLESLVGRAYGEIHEVRSKVSRFRPFHWLFRVFPRTFRRRIGAFWLACAITLMGALFGGGAVVLDPGAKDVLLPFPHLQVDPSERVRDEELVRKSDPRAGQKAMGTSFYFTHNTKVSLTCMALGITWGVGTMILLFGNGVMLGAVCLDYFQAGEAKFLIGWLLPHGSFEIPAILIAGQAGLLLGHALIGWGSRTSVKGRLREAAPDIVTLIGGVAILLAWAGFIEAFLSQYHEPVIPYAAKIVFGVIELVLLISFLTLAGRTRGNASSFS